MDHFRDITSFSSISRVLHGTPKSVNDVADFLNFLSQLIFCNSVSVSVLGPDQITDGTIDVINKLIALGVPKDFIVKYNYPIGIERLKQRSRIIDDLKYDWLESDIFPVLKSGNKYNFPEGYFEMLESSVSILNDVLIYDKPPSSYLSEIEESLSDKRISYMVGLILSDSDLVYVIREHLKKQNASRNEMFDFIAIVRHKYNILLSHDLKLAFTPTSSRALNNRVAAKNMINTYREMDEFKNKINRSLRSELEELKLAGENFELCIPSALHFLISNECSSVAELVDRALMLRDQLSWYRESVLFDFNRLKFSTKLEDQKKLKSRLDSGYHDVIGYIANKNNRSVAQMFGQFSMDLTEFGAVSATFKGVRSFISLANNLNFSSKKAESALLTQDLINYMSKDDSDYKNLINRLYVRLGGNYKDLVKP